MERKLHNVISLEEEKMRIDHLPDGSAVVVKKTTETEFVNLVEVSSHLQNGGDVTLCVGKKSFSVTTPKIVSWDAENGVLSTEHFHGENLEILLLDLDTSSRTKNIDILKSFIAWMKQKGIIWKDAAPRNILIDKEERIICMVDFEKGNILRNSPYSDSEFNSHVRGIVFEEMCAFTFPQEQQLIFGHIWEEEDRIIPVTSFRGKREPILYRRLFGEFSDQISTQKLAYVQKLMADTVTPYYIHDSAFFPLVLLAKAGSPERYTSLLLELTEIPRDRWPEYLTNSIQG